MAKNNKILSNKDLIKLVFNNEKFIDFNKWFFEADWEKLNISDLKNSYWLEIKYIIWNNGTWKSGMWENGVWKNGVWENGTWEYGFWHNGVWKHGIWKNGTWEKGVWKHGSWYNGIWKDGTWYQGVWYKGSWEKGTWKEGKIWDFNNKEYIKSTVPPNECKWSLSYGK